MNHLEKIQPRIGDRCLVIVPCGDIHRQEVCTWQHIDPTEPPEWMGGYPINKWFVDSNGFIEINAMYWKHEPLTILQRINNWLEKWCLLLVPAIFLILYFIINSSPRAEHKRIVAQDVPRQIVCLECAQ